MLRAHQRAHLSVRLQWTDTVLPLTAASMASEEDAQTAVTEIRPPPTALRSLREKHDWKLNSSTAGRSQSVQISSASGRALDGGTPLVCETMLSGRPYAR